MDSTNSLSDDTYTCSLCCDEVFNSKTEVIEHLTQLISNILCPICKEHFISLQCLIDHLTHNECDAPENTLKFGIDTQLENSETILPHFDSDLQNTIPSQVNNEDNSDIRKVYEEFQTKGSTKSQEINISQSSNGQYIILAQDDLTDAVVTKNNDGTISLTAIQDMETEADTAINKMESETSQQNDVEVYSCNACGVSFTSVLEHIQTYHKYEEVVVEEPVDENVDTPDPLYAAVQDNQAPRRVITDTGDIVVENDHQSATVSSEPYSKEQKPEAVPKKPSPKRYMKVEKLCDSVVKNIKEERKITDYHKVVVKHMKTTKGMVKLYNCVHCNAFVTSLNDLATKQCKKFKYQCPHCDVAYENSKSLCAHMNIHKTKKVVSEIAPDAKVTFDCKTCNTTFPTNKSLKLHMRMHAPVKIRQIEPPLNTERGEPNNDKFLCSICDKLIPIDYRAVHHNSHKTDTDNLNCDICNKKFTTPEYLEMHMSVHNLHRITLNNPDKELPYSCLYCHRKFARPHEKVKHERIHTGEKPHSCVICGKSFRVSYCLTLHMRTHTGARPYACPHCPKRFKAHSVYNHHLLTHSEVRAYKCPVCPKAFKTLVQLAGHKNSHTKPFSCQQCNRPFASLYAVRVHTETHNKQNNLKFSCNHCGASYARVSALKDHIKQAHNIHTENNDANGDATIKDDWNLKAVTEDAPMEEQTIDKAYEATIKDDWNLKAVTEDAPMHEQTIDKAYEIVLELPSNELIV